MECRKDAVLKILTVLKILNGNAFAPCLVSVYSTAMVLVICKVKAVVSNRFRGARGSTSREATPTANAFGQGELPLLFVSTVDEKAQEARDRLLALR